MHCADTRKEFMRANIPDEIVRKVEEVIKAAKERKMTKEEFIAALARLKVED